MKSKTLTDSEILLLGLVAEMPRHGYELEQIIKQRDMRRWTQIGFSSIYFVLGKLEKYGFVNSIKPNSAKTKKTYSITNQGQQTLEVQTLDALKYVRPTYSSALLGMANWPILKKQNALNALAERINAINQEIAKLKDIQIKQQPLPDYVEALFEHSMSQLIAEAKWAKSTLEYMKTKPWLTDEDET